MDNRVDYDNPQKYHDEFDKKLEFDFKNGLSATETNKERSNSSSNETRTEDIEKAWRKCIRPGSIMARHLKISDELLKALNASQSNTDNSEQNSDSHRSFVKDLPRYCEDLKKRFCIVANLLGVYPELGSTPDVPIDLTKPEIIDVYIKKVQI